MLQYGFIFILYFDFYMTILVESNRILMIKSMHLKKRALMADN